jgi:quaternary ammonium compound-resistance protein SugE
MLGSDAAEAAIPDEGESYPGCKDDRGEGGWVVMPSVGVNLSGLLESVWAIALSRSAGFTRVAPSVVFVLGLVGNAEHGASVVAA